MHFMEGGELFSKWNIVGAILSFALGGPVGLCVFIALWGVFWYYTSRRGLLFVQSYLYLVTLWDTNDSIKANWKANNLTPSRAIAYMQSALEFAQRHNGGMQLPVIEEARKNGFVYKGKSLFDLLK